MVFVLRRPRQPRRKVNVHLLFNDENKKGVAEKNKAVSKAKQEEAIRQKKIEQLLERARTSLDNQEAERMLQEAASIDNEAKVSEIRQARKDPEYEAKRGLVSCYRPNREEIHRRLLERTRIENEQTKSYRDCERRLAESCRLQEELKKNQAFDRDHAGRREALRMKLKAVVASNQQSAITINSEDNGHQVSVGMRHWIQDQDLTIDHPEYVQIRRRNSVLLQPLRNASQHRATPATNCYAHNSNSVKANALSSSNPFSKKGALPERHQIGVPPRNYTAPSNTIHPSKSSPPLMITAEFEGRFRRKSAQWFYD